MRGAIIRLVACALGLSVSGCYPEPLTLSLNFPYDETFLYSETADLYIFSATDRSECPGLIDYEVLGIGEQRVPLQQHTDIPVCELRNGGGSAGYLFDDVGEGLRAFVIVARDQLGRALLSGCIIDETAVGAEPITLNLSITDHYQQYTDDIDLNHGGINCDTVEEKCTRGC